MYHKSCGRAESCKNYKTKQKGLRIENDNFQNLNSFENLDYATIILISSFFYEKNFKPFTNEKMQNIFHCFF